jgi:prevent-host-death family protein
MEETVGVRRLRDQWTRYLSRVRRGGRIIITDRGRPVALLQPYVEVRSNREERLKAILSSGHVAPAERQFLSRAPLVRGRGPLPSDLIGEGRR